MADSLFKTNSVRVNMFKPDSTNSAIVEKVTKLLKSIDNGNPNYCDILFERIARRTAGILDNQFNNYNLNIHQVEELYGLNDLRKSFACKGIDLLEIMSHFVSNDDLLATELSEVITTENNLIIKINL